MTRKITSLLFVALLTIITFQAKADEGMWLPIHLKRMNEADMQKHGLKLTADEIYNINNTSLKDAVVWFGGFCSGEMISGQGLILTNHHCGYDAIQNHSTVTNDYLSNGFWAMNKKEELPNKGLTASFLVRMEDVTAKVLATVGPNLGEKERNAAIQKAMATVKKEAEAGTHYNAQVKSFFNGNEFYLLVYETFRDVRLVGAPPSSVGKFGGETDNWMWPRHTGDFSMFRIYAGKDGKPADYSADNVPFTPRKHLPVSVSGYKEGDFAMIMGWPGRTDRYLSSFGVKMSVDLVNPMRVKIRRAKLDIIENFGATDKATKILYASKYAQVSNYWKYFIGQTAGLKRLKVAERKADTEREFQTWVSADATRTAKYGEAIKLMDASYQKWYKYRAFEVAYGEAIRGAEINNIALELMEIEELLKKGVKADDAEMKEAIAKLRKEVDGELYDEYNPVLEQEMYATTNKLFAEYVPADQLPAAAFDIITKKFKGDYAKHAAMVYQKSFLATKDKLKAFLDKPSLKTLQNDPAYSFSKEIYSTYRNGIAPMLSSFTEDLDKGNRLFTAGLMEMKKNQNFYPNANSTMRVTYGNILKYTPKDAVTYNFYTTIDGIMEKEDPSNPEFEVPAKLKALYKAKDYGQYAVDGTIPVAFLSNTDITGGNSGSAVINGKGELIGTAFDGNWEAMSGDIAFEPSLQRTISLDIRYTLFIIDKYAGAKHLVDEMTLVRDVVEAPKPAEVVTTPVTAPPMPPAPVKEKVKAVQTPVKQAKKANAAAVPAAGKTVK